MIRMYCDQCGEEIETKNRLKRRLGRVSVEVIVAVDGTWNGGHVCHNCIIEAVSKGQPMTFGQYEAMKSK